METLKVLSPYDEGCIGELNLVGAAEIETMLSTAHSLFSDRSCWLPKRDRLSILRKAAELIRERRESLAVQAASEGGKPLVDSLVEIDRAADGIECCVEEIRTSA
ncbi:MAG: aldehyde dehydrogenase family protein, partial [Rhodospirillales bacterium]|nr:aldehyde dehydrogenase family protein [Rhodospirillales bacterium]